MIIIKKKTNKLNKGNTYQKAVKLKKLEVVVMEAIDPTANTHCEILKISPVKG